MGRPKSDTIDVATEERVLQAAEVEFGTAGFVAARLEDIASRAGITRPSLFYHFASKDQLYAAVVHRAFGGLRDALVAAFTAPLPFEERFQGTVDAYLDFLQAHPQLAAILLREVIGGPGPGRDLVKTDVVPLIDLVEQFVSEEGRGRVRDGLHVRGAIMMVIASPLVQVAAGPLREPLWGPIDRTRDLARQLFFGR